MKGETGKDGRDAVPLIMQVEQSATKYLLGVSPVVSAGEVFITQALPSSLVQLVIQVVYESTPPRQFGGDGEEAEFNFGNVSLLIGGSQQLPFYNLSRSEAVIDVPYVVGKQIKLRFSARTNASIAYFDSGLRRVFYRVANPDSLPVIYL